MAIVRSEMEMWELKAVVLCCGVLHLMSGNLWDMKFAPDVPSTIITMASVILLHHLRGQKVAVTKTWHLCLDVVLIYVGSQIIMALIWEKFCYALEVLRAPIATYRIARFIFQNQIEWLITFGVIFVYCIKLIVAIGVSYRIAKRTCCFENLMSQQRSNDFFANPTMMDMSTPPPQSQPQVKKNASKTASTRSTSKKRSRTRSQSTRRRRR